MTSRSLSPSKGLDFTPAPAAAPPLRRVWRHARTEATLLVRNGEQLLLALVIPVAVLLAGRWFEERVGSFAQLAPSVLALAIWSTGFTSVAISTGFERRYGVLERLAATPLGRGGLLLGKAVAVIMIVLGQLIVLGVIAAVAGWRPHPNALSAAVGVASIVLGGAVFVALALLLAGQLRAEATLALSNVIYVVLLVAGALVLPVERYPAVLRPVLRVLPTGALGESLRAAAVGVVLWWPPLVLAGWLVIVGFLTRKVFRWLS